MSSLLLTLRPEDVVSNCGQIYAPGHAQLAGDLNRNACHSP